MLNHHRVDYVVIGVFVAIAQGAPIEATHDVGLTPRGGAENLRRLSEALDELDARIRVDDLEEALAFDHDAESLAAMAMLNLTCVAGDFDIIFSPAALRSFNVLLESSVQVRVGEELVAVACLEDVLRSKEEVGREKDVRAAVVIRAYLRNQQG